MLNSKLVFSGSLPATMAEARTSSSVPQTRLVQAITACRNLTFCSLSVTFFESSSSSGNRPYRFLIIAFCKSLKSFIVALF